MSIFKEYMEYLRDNPQGFWFKRKLYGWGWTPALWQGWAILGVFLFYVVWVAIRFAHEAKIGTLPEEDVISFTIKIALAFIVLIAICYLKGEKPRWQWGPSDDTNQKP